jgi:hypothetical protein
LGRLASFYSTGKGWKGITEGMGGITLDLAATTYYPATWSKEPRVSRLSIGENWGKGRGEAIMGKSVIVVVVQEGLTDGKFEVVLKVKGLSAFT